MRKRKRAILWGRDDVLTQAMESFLKAKKTWRVEIIFVDQGSDWFVEQVKRAKPDVIVLHNGDYAVHKSLLMQLIEERPKLKVVVVGLENNLTQVYSKHSFLLREASDLLSILEDGHLSDHQISEGGEERQAKEFID